MACCSCLTSLAYSRHDVREYIRKRCNERYLLNGEFLVSLYSDLPSLLKCLLLNEGHLDTRLLKTVIWKPFWDMIRTNHLVHLTEYFIIVQRTGCHGCWMGEKDDTRTEIGSSLNQESWMTSALLTVSYLCFLLWAGRNWQAMVRMFCC